MPAKPATATAAKAAPFTVSMALVRGIVAGASRRGHSPDGFLQRAGIAPGLLAQEGARVTSDQYIALMWRVLEALGDEALGQFSRPLKRGSLELIARLALTERHAEPALRRMCQAFSLLQDNLELSLVREDAQVGICLQPLGSEPQPNFRHEFSLRVLWRITAWLLGGSLKVQRFDFAFARPDYAGDYGETFPAPLRFDQQASAFWFDAAVLQRCCSRDEQALQRFVASWPSAAVIHSRGGDSIESRVHAHLLQSRPAWVGLEAAACALHMSPPTLQRKLALAGTSFQAIKDELRRDIAVSRLGTSQASFTDLAADLGFADAAAFQRAFKGWTGSPPGMYRSRPLQA
ncbi:AraC family transcriptional regulator [Comamonas aquatilis]|uniref:AraC family transcriptional regulator n=1 Tax=Comamonas aquatilis TaxID=1778406 RepID=UPI0039F05333